MMLVETNAGAGVGLGSPPNMSHPSTTDRVKAHTVSFQNTPDVMF